MKGKFTFHRKIFLIALLLRVIPVILTRSLGIGLDDMFQYDMLARSLASGKGFRWYAYNDLKILEPYVDFDLSSLEYDSEKGVLTSFRAPFYPIFLALIYSLIGAGVERFFVVRLVQAGLNALIAPLTYHVSQRLFPSSEHASITAAWVVACYPLLIIYPIGLATENLFFLFVLSSFYFLLLSSAEPTTKHFFLAGLFLALSSLTRSVILPFAGLATAWSWIIIKQRRGAIVMTLTMLVMIVPWVMRNSLLHNKLTGIESSMGYNLYLGYHPDSDGSFTFGPSLDLIAILDDAERDRLGTEKALKFIRTEPDRFLPLALNRLGFFFGLEKRALIYLYSNNLLGYIPKSILLTIASILLLPFVVVSTSAALGLALARRRPGTILLYSLLFLCVLPHIFILSEDRFHLAILPYLAILASQAWTGGWRGILIRWQESLSDKIAVSLVVVTVLLLFLNWGLELFRDADKITALLGPHGNQTHFPY